MAESDPNAGPASDTVLRRLPTEELHRTGFFADDLVPLNIEFGFGAPVIGGREGHGFVSVFRPARQGDFGTTEVASLSMLLPHIQRALYMNRMLARVNAEKERSLAALDRR